MIVLFVSTYHVTRTPTNRSADTVHVIKKLLGFNRYTLSFYLSCLNSCCIIFRALQLFHSNKINYNELHPACIFQSYSDIEFNLVKIAKRLYILLAQVHGKNVVLAYFPGTHESPKKVLANLVQRFGQL